MHNMPPIKFAFFFFERLELRQESEEITFALFSESYGGIHALQTSQRLRARQDLR